MVALLAVPSCVHALLLYYMLLHAAADVRRTVLDARISCTALHCIAFSARAVPTSSACFMHADGTADRPMAGNECGSRHILCCCFLEATCTYVRIDCRIDGVLRHVSVFFHVKITQVHVAALVCKGESMCESSGLMSTCTLGEVAH